MNAQLNSLTQDQVEALVRLLLAGRRQDGVVSAEENATFDKQVAALPWNSKTDRRFFVVTEAARIRNTVALHRASFIAEQCAHFPTPALGAVVLDVLQRVIGADGTAAEENAFLAEVQNALK